VGLGLLLAVGIVGGVLLARTWAWAAPRLDGHDDQVKALLQVKSHRPFIIFKTKEDLTQTDFQTFQKTQADLIRSPLVLEKALGDPAVAALPTVRRQVDPVEWLGAALKVDFSPESEVIEVSLGGDGAPGDRVKILQAVVESYRKWVVNAEHEDRLRRLQYLETLNAEFIDDLKAKRERLRQLAEQFGGERRLRQTDEALSLRETTLLDLRLKEVEARTLLERHKGREDAPELEDRLAVIVAQREAILEERKELEEEAQARRANVMDLQTEQAQVATLEKTSQEVAREIQALKVELSAPPRVEVISQPRLPRDDR
jgi:hypothetical protein